MIDLEYLGACRSAYEGTPNACGGVLLVGEDNPYGATPEFALYCAPEGCSGQRLQSRILGLRRATYLAIWRTNLCVGKWSTKAAMARAHELLAPDAPWRVIVMLGRKVADAFQRTALGGRAAPPFAVAVCCPGVTLVSLPHPSGRNTIWNDPRRVTDARMLLAEISPHVPWGEAEFDTPAREAP